MTGKALFALVCLGLVACGPDEHIQSASTTRSALDAAPDNQSNFAARLLAAHNAARKARNLAPLTWSAQLAVDAQGWAQTIASDGKLRHSDKASRPGEGENIWMGTAAFYSLEHMMARFTDEEANFRPGTFPDVSTTGTWQDVAHYTQIIWPDTKQVGCALASANGRDALVCRYSPPGNIFTQRVG